MQTTIKKLKQHIEEFPPLLSILSCGTNKFIANVKCVWHGAMSPKITETMKQNLEFLSQLNIIAIVCKAIRVIDKCYKDKCENQDLEKEHYPFCYVEFPEDFDYNEFYLIMERGYVASPLRVADMISAYYMDSTCENTYLLKLLIEKLDLEFDTKNEYKYYRRFIKDHDFNLPGTFDVECFIKHMPILRKRIELTFGVDIYATHNSNNNISSNLIGQCYLRKVYDYVCDDAFKGISFKEFERCVIERNFSKIYNSEYAKASVIKYLIYVLSKHIDSESWYRDTAHSINTEPQKCSGASVPKQWRRELNAIKA